MREIPMEESRQNERSSGVWGKKCRSNVRVKVSPMPGAFLVAFCTQHAEGDVRRADERYSSVLPRVRLKKGNLRNNLPPRNYSAS